MKNLVKKLVLSVLVATTIITTVPVSNVQAAVKKEYLNHVYKTINLEKTTPEQYVKLIETYGVKGIREKKHYIINYYVKTKNDTQAVKKINAFTQKLQKAKNNRYGISMGVQIDEGNAERVKRTKGKCIYSPILSANDIVYMERTITKALRQKTFNIKGYNKDKVYGTITARTKDVFPNSAAFKKASDSVKVQFVNDYIGRNCFVYGGAQDGYYDDFSIQAIATGKFTGNCDSAMQCYMWTTRAIAYIEDLAVTSKNPSAISPLIYDKFNHATMVAKVRNSYGTFDYLEGNNNEFKTYSYPTDGLTEKNPYTIANTLAMEKYEPYLETSGNKWGNSKNNSELFNICYDLYVK